VRECGGKQTPRRESAGNVERGKDQRCVQKIARKKMSREKRTMSNGVRDEKPKKVPPQSSDTKRKLALVVGGGRGKLNFRDEKKSPIPGERRESQLKKVRAMNVCKQRGLQGDPRKNHETPLREKEGKRCVK